MIRAGITGVADTLTQVQTQERQWVQRVDAGIAAIADGILTGARQRVLAQRAASGPSALAASLFIVPRDGGLIIGTAAPYAPFVEFGTARQPARPFLFPAALAARDQTRFHFAPTITG